MQQSSINAQIPPEAKPYTIPISQKEFGKRSITEEYKILDDITTDKQYISKLVRDDCYRNLNRYIDILPFEHSIVKLDEKKLSPDNYMNGNYLYNPLLSDQKKSFILTQGPLDHTVNNFWRMVDVEGVSNVISIVETNNLGLRCAKYWPEKKMKTSNYEIETINHSKNSLFHKKEFNLTNLTHKTVRKVNHYHIFNWIDFSTLNVDDMNGLLNLIDILYKERSKNFSPIVVHCSAGVGRSGTFAAIFFAYEFWKFCEKQGIEFKISIFDLLLQMRGMRFGLVQTLQQYKFIYAVVRKFK